MLVKQKKMKMIAAESERFVPFGRKFLDVHPKGANRNENDEKWFIQNGSKEFDCEEEVYASGSVVVWSNSSCNSDRKAAKKCYSLDNEVKQITLCQFHGLSNSHHIRNYHSDFKHSNADMIRCICVLGPACVDMLGLDGCMYASPLPFKVDAIWPLPNGFCVQRDTPGVVDANDSKSVPTLFSLVHPLDDFSPVVYRYPDSKKSFYFADNDQQIVFSSTTIPLLVTFDVSNGTHVVWKVRKATTQDKPDPVATEDNSQTMPQKFGNISSRIPSRLSSSFTGQNSSFHASTPSPAMISRSHPHTPARAATPLGLIRMHSSALKSNVPVNRLVSPHSAMMHEASTSSDHTFTNSSHNRSHGWFSSPMVYRLPSDDPVTHEDHEFESMPPSVCFEHIWEEEGDQRESCNESNTKKKADSVFISEDFSGQSFLCLLMKETQVLRLIEMEYRSVTSSYYFGSSTNLEAKDAGTLNKLKMIVVLDLSSDVLLYSGTIKIFRFDVFANIPSQYPHEMSSGLELLRSSYGTGTPRTKSISRLEHSMPHIAFFRDFTRERFSLVLHNGEIYRIHIPKVTTDELVANCLDVVVRCHENVSAIDLIGRYYSVLNEPSICQSSPKWKIFMDTTLMLMGFPETLRKSMITDEGSSPSPPQPKKAKKSDSFCENVDWYYMLESGCFQEMKSLFDVKDTTSAPKSNSLEELRLNSNMPLFSLIPNLLDGWHLLYEDLKLNVMAYKQRKDLANLLFILSRCLHLDNHKNYYIEDFPGIDKAAVKILHIHKDQLDELLLRNEKNLHPKSIENYLVQEMALSKMLPEFSSPFKTTQLIAKTTRCITSFISSGITASPDSMISELQISDPCKKRLDCTEKFLELFLGFGFRKADLERLPFGLAIVFQELLHNYRHNAPSYLPAPSSQLLNREDLAAQIGLSESKSIHGMHPQSGNVKDLSEKELFKIRFSCDLRIEEVKRLLDSSSPVNINIGQKPEVSDHDFIKEQEAKLLLLSKRSMALSVGRGMFTLCTHTPMIGETINIPTLDLTGKASQSNKIITLSSQTDLTPDQLQWPSFHNGVAAGLRVIHGSSQIDSTWIVYNKLKYKELNEELSGFMMALGLTGHLHVLPPHLIYDYLAKGREFTSIGILLGIAASRCRSKDAAVYKLLAVHVDALLPATALEISIPHSAQVAALLATGLLYMETIERHLIKILLQEISRPPGPEMENAVDRESHSLAAGFALGMVLLGKGTDSLYLSDLRIAEELHHLAFGGQQCQLPTYLRETFKSPSYLIKEGDSLNTDVTCPSAVMALTLIFLKTSNKVVANWFKPPDTSATLENVKPDNLLLMLLARGLILWDETLPSIGWIQGQLPKIFDDVSFDVKQSRTHEADQETLRLGYCCVIAGSCMALGMKFAGSTNKAAFETLMHFTNMFKKLVANPIFEKGGKAIVEMCFASILLSVSMVMAGSGNLQVLRIARSLRRRVHADISYGTYLAIHMAIGFLFLGGGRYTLSTNNKAIAGLLCALYPKFPHNSKDNRYHLQAFRHLYILACEPRLVIPRDVDTGGTCYVPLHVKLKETASYSLSTIKLLAPCFIPEFSLIDSIQVQGPRYWPITIQFDDQHESWEELFKIIGCLFVKKKAGYLSYSDDPKGHRNLMARTFTNQSEKLETMSSFSSNMDAILLGEMFCKSEKDSEQVNSEFLSNILFECVSNEKLDVWPTYINIERTIVQAENGVHDVQNMKQLLLLFHFYNILHPKLKASGVVGKPLISENYLIQAQLRLERSSIFQQS